VFFSKRSKDICIEPPNELTTIDLACLSHWRIKLNDIAAMILELSMEGYLEIIDSNVLDNGERSTDAAIRLKRLRDYDGNHPAKKYLIKILFSHDDTIKLSELKGSYDVFRELKRIIHHHRARMDASAIKSFHSFAKLVDLKQLNTLLKQSPQYLYHIFPYIVALGLDGVWKQRFDNINLVEPANISTYAHLQNGWNFSMYIAVYQGILEDLAKITKKPSSTWNSGEFLSSLANLITRD
jgi:hypothetical protein